MSLIQAVDPNNIQIRFTTSYEGDFNAKGDNRDAMYLMTPEFTLNSDEDFIVVYSVDNENPLVMAFRAFLDQTGTGASYYEVIYDRAIVFHKKTADNP